VVFTDVDLRLCGCLPCETMSIPDQFPRRNQVAAKLDQYLKVEAKCKRVM
jgi:hypothetical protein